MWQKIVSFLKMEWLANKSKIVDGIITALDGTKPLVKDAILAQLKASGQDLTKMSIEDAVTMIEDIAYQQIEIVIKRQI